MNPEPVFSAPRRRTVTLSRTLWVAGKGLPKGGVCVGCEGCEITVATDNGSAWYTDLCVGKRVVRVAVMPSTL